MVQILTFQINLSTAQILSHTFSVVQQGRSVSVVAIQSFQLFLKLGVVFVVLVCFLQFQHCVHQSFGDVLSTVNTISTFGHFSFAPYISQIFAVGVVLAYKKPAPDCSRTGENYIYLRYHLVSLQCSALSQSANTPLVLNADVTLADTLVKTISPYPQRSIYRTASLSGSQHPELSVSASFDLISVSTVCGYY